MNSLQAYLDNHEDPARRQAQAAARGRAADAWQAMGQTPEQRLLAFDQWLCRQLETRLQWPENPVKKAKLLGQCRAELEKLVLELWRRGWMLDGKRLADHISDALGQIAERQRAGQVKDFYPFFRFVVTSYVGTHAEEIQAEARRIPTMGSLIGSLGITRQLKQSQPSIPELVAARKDETIKEKLAKQRRRREAEEGEKDQLSLL
jgi:hypothetical protein